MDSCELYDFMTDRQLQRAKRLKGKTLVPTFNIGDEVNVRCGLADKKKRQATSAWSARALILRPVTNSPNNYYLTWITLGLCNEGPGVDSKRAYPAFKLRLYPGGARGVVPVVDDASDSDIEFNADTKAPSSEEEGDTSDSDASTDSSASTVDTPDTSARKEPLPRKPKSPAGPKTMVGGLVSVCALRWTTWAEHKFGEAAAPYVWYTGEIVEYHGVSNTYKVGKFKHDQLLHVMDPTTVKSGCRNWAALGKPAVGTCVRANRKKPARTREPPCKTQEMAPSSDSSDLEAPAPLTDLDVNPNDKDAGDYATEPDSDQRFADTDALHDAIYDGKPTDDPQTPNNSWSEDVTGMLTQRYTCTSLFATNPIKNTTVPPHCTTGHRLRISVEEVPLQQHKTALGTTQSFHQTNGLLHFITPLYSQCKYLYRM
jgi:hypothetical protein